MRITNVIHPSLSVETRLLLQPGDTKIRHLSPSEGSTTFQAAPHSSSIWSDSAGIDEKQKPQHNRQSFRLLTTFQDFAHDRHQLIVAQAIDVGVVFAYSDHEGDGFAIWVNRGLGEFRRVG